MLKPQLRLTGCLPYVRSSAKALYVLCCLTLTTTLRCRVADMLFSLSLCSGRWVTQNPLSWRTCWPNWPILQLSISSRVTSTPKSCLAQDHTYSQASPYLTADQYKYIKAIPAPEQPLGPPEAVMGPALWLDFSFCPPIHRLWPTEHPLINIMQAKLGLSLPPGKINLQYSSSFSEIEHLNVSWACE